MSITVIRTIFCDGPGEPEGTGRCTVWFGEEIEPASEVRRMARARGWKTERGGKDYCPDCVHRRRFPDGDPS